ncbi:hypothetical protein PENTCL1PPCAC_2578, partial [Pristionchus entomophagus]
NRTIDGTEQFVKSAIAASVEMDTSILINDSFNLGLFAIRCIERGRADVCEESIHCGSRAEIRGTSWIRVANQSSDSCEFHILDVSEVPIASRVTICILWKMQNLCVEFFKLPMQTMS